MSETWEPALPTAADLDRISAQLGNPRPSLSEGLGAAFEQGFQDSTFGALGALGREVQGERADPAPMSREEWQASGLARPKMEWDERMTRGRAEAMARTFDERQRLARVQAARDPGAFESALQFGAAMGGSVFDPANLLPITPALRLGLEAAGRVAPGVAGRVLGEGAEILARPGLGASVGRGVTDATLGNAAVAPLIYGVQERYGEDVTFGTVLRDLSIGALLGAGFGAAGHALARATDPTTAIRALDAAATDLAAGRPMEVTPALAARGLEDAMVRSAPIEVRDAGMVRDTASGQQLDLPRSPDGTPLTREQFHAELEARTPRPAIAQGDARYVEVGGQRFVALEGGSPDIARLRPEVAADAGLVPGPIRLPEGRHDHANDRGNGEIHIDARHGEQIRALGYPDVAAFVQDVAARANEVRGDPNGSLFLIARDPRVASNKGKQPALIVGLETMNGAYEVRTAGPFQNSYIAKREKLWPREGTLDGPVGQDHSLYSPSLPKPDAPETPSPGGGQSVATVVRSGADFNDAYAWYRDALDAERQVERLATATPAPESRAQQPEATRAAQQEGEPASALPGLERQQLEAMRAEGRLTAADEAILRAGDEAAAEIEGAAKGLREAGECLLRNMT